MVAIQRQIFHRTGTNAAHPDLIAGLEPGSLTEVCVVGRAAADDGKVVAERNGSNEQPEHNQGDNSAGHRVALS